MRVLLFADLGLMLKMFLTRINMVQIGTIPLGAKGSGMAPSSLFSQGVGFVYRCGRYGFIVAMTGVDNAGKGLIRDGTGMTFQYFFKCFEYFGMAFSAEAGLVQIFVSNHVVAPDLSGETLSVNGSHYWRSALPRLPAMKITSELEYIILKYVVSSSSLMK
ncbi:hypothetical protein C5167_049505 [Papaver somniferum]|uniref:Uncharacterized protein n=1 Tax=Papaver somniferum TaxID=3469 RepID=A0A4Y7KL03_PAPSO|nr:hypothetical protein C5167_049505 [Papaver somniferum]